MSDAIFNSAGLSITLSPEKGGCRLRYKSHDIVFSESESGLRKRLDAALSKAVTHYSGNLAAAGVTMEPMRVAEIALAVVLHTLRILDGWRQFYPQYKGKQLVLEDVDLAHPQSHDICWAYCQKECGADYQRFAAALTGMSLEQYRAYEAGRERFYDR